MKKGLDILYNLRYDCLIHQGVYRNLVKHMKQNSRKNKTNQQIIFPTTPYFTIKELHSLNPKFIEITLRVRLTNDVEDGKVAEIGSLPGGKGRPQKAFSLTPVTQTTLNKARQDNVNLVDNADKLVNIINVNHTAQSAVTPSVTTPTSTVR